jgi:hypothetical protein
VEAVFGVLNLLLPDVPTATAESAKTPTGLVTVNNANKIATRLDRCKDCALAPLPCSEQLAEAVPVVLVLALALALALACSPIVDELHHRLSPLVHGTLAARLRAILVTNEKQSGAALPQHCHTTTLALDKASGGAAGACPRRVSAKITTADPIRIADPTSCIRNCPSEEGLCGSNRG